MSSVNRSLAINQALYAFHWKPQKQAQANLVIRGRSVPLFWTANTEFADKKTQFD